MTDNYSDQYKAKLFPFPSDTTEPEDRDDKWHLAWAQAIYSYYVQNRCGVRYSDKDLYDTNRRYANGTQSPNIYMDMLLGNETDFERQGWMNVNFDDIFSPAPKYMTAIQGIFESIEHDILARAIDEKSAVEREISKEKLWVKKMFKEQFDQVNQVLGIPQEMNQEILPESREELDMFEKMGGFKFKHELAQEKAIAYTLEFSDYKEIKRKVISDFATLNMAGIIDLVDEYTGKSKIEYIDPANLIIEYCGDRDYRKARFAGIPLTYSIVDLRTQNKGDFTEEELAKYAQQFSTYLGNDQRTVYNRGGDIDSDGSYKYNDYKIPVIYFCWKSAYPIYEEYEEVEIPKYKIRKNELKTGKIVEKNGKFFKQKRINKKISEIQVVHHCKWIVGTDKVFQYGLMNDIVKKKNIEAVLPIHFVKLSGRSIVDLMRPVLDQIEMIWLRLQNAIAKAPPPGLAIEHSALQNISLGGETMKPLDMIKMYRQTGDIIYRATPFHGHYQPHVQGKLIEELVGGVGQAIVESIRAFELCFNQLSELSGIDRTTTASINPNTEMAVGTQKMAVAATNNILKPIYAQYLRLKENCATNISYRIQLITYHTKLEENPYLSILGRPMLEALKEAGTNPPSEYGIKIYARPTDEMKAEIRALAVEAMKVGKNGQPGITMGEYMFIMEQLNTSHGLTYARAFLTYKEQKNKEEDLKLQRENMTIQNENNIRLAQEQKKLEMESTKFNTDEQIRLEYFKSLFKATIENKEKSKQELEKIALQNHFTTVNADKDFAREQFTQGQETSQQPITA